MVMLCLTMKEGQDFIVLLLLRFIPSRMTTETLQNVLQGYTTHHHYDVVSDPTVSSPVWIPCDNVLLSHSISQHSNPRITLDHHPLASFADIQPWYFRIIRGKVEGLVCRHQAHRPTSRSFLRWKQKLKNNNPFTTTKQKTSQELQSKFHT